MQNQELGDYIGAESCIDLKPDVADIIISHGGAATNRKRCQRRTDAAEKEYPPAIPSLVMKKYITSDGRLVIKEEKVQRRRDYFQAHRCNGRLVLNLVHENDAVEDRAGDGEEEINGGDEGVNDPMGEEVRSERSDYKSGIGVNPCGGYVAAMAVAELRPPVVT